MMLNDSVRTLWDEWFDSQYDLTRCIENAVADQSKGKDHMFTAALYTAVIEHAAEQLRSHIDLSKESTATEEVKSDG